MCECTVVLLPANAEAWTPDARRIRASKPDTSGEVVIDALPHGEYLIVAVRNLAARAGHDTAVLRSLLPWATPVRIEGVTSVGEVLRVFTRDVEGVKEFLPHTRR